MCLGNRAENSAHYINSQLVALWENAVRCSQKHGTGLKPTTSEVEYGTCLYEFYGPGKHNRHHASKQDLSCFATFGAPRIEFVCNHEVILFLDIKEGHYNLDVTKDSPKPELREKISHFSFAFRLDFSTHSVNNVHCKEIGNSEYVMNLFVLDIASASFCEAHSTLPGITSATDEKSFYTKERRLHSLTHYLTKHYLPLLKRAGYHTLHSLPDFDNLTSTTAHVDYSVISKRALSVDKLFGIDIDNINTYLKGLWLQAAAYVDEHGTHHGHATDLMKHYLAEHRTNWAEFGEDMHFHMTLGPLQVQALCRREVVLYLDLQDVHFHLGGGFVEKPHHKFSDWKIAVLVDVIYEETEGGSVRRIKLNLSTARFCEHLSILSADFEDVELLIRLKTTLVRYITRYYLQIIEAAGHHCIFHTDIRISVRGGEPDDDTSSEEGSSGYGCDCQDEGSCGHEDNGRHVRWYINETERITHTHMHEFDQVTAVTQGSINVHFKAIWDLARRKAASLGANLHTWSSRQIELETCIADYSLAHADHGGEIFFSASFGAPKIQLMCNEGSRSVILYLTMHDGYLKTLGSNRCLVSGGKEHTFAQWRVAFTINLKLQDCSKEHKVSDSILKLLGRENHDDFKQLVLDFSSAKFCQALSTVPGLLDGTDYRLIRGKREALIHYLTSFYFTTLVQAGHHVLYTLPLCEKGELGISKRFLTSVTFQIYPFTFGSRGTFVEALFGKQRVVSERNMILFLGMTDHHKHPHGHLPRRGNWVGGIGKEVPHGTVCLSRRVFLEQRILKALTRINAETTIFPSFSGVHNGKWVLGLTPWSKREYLKDHGCDWEENTVEGSDSLNFEWNNSDKWRYEHKGDSSHHNVYNVECETHNKVSIPTTHKHGSCKIKIDGIIRLVLAYAGSGKDWRWEMTAKWSAAIILSSDGDHGVKVDMPAKIVPTFETSGDEGEMKKSTTTSPFDQVKAQLPTAIDLNHIVEELRGSFKGVAAHLHLGSQHFHITNPAFNRHGDLLLELQIPKAEKHGTSRPPLAHANESWFRHLKHQVVDVLLPPKLPASTPPPHYSPPLLKSSASKVSIKKPPTPNGVRNGAIGGSNDVEGL